MKNILRFKDTQIIIIIYILYRSKLEDMTNMLLKTKRLNEKLNRIKGTKDFLCMKQNKRKRHN